MGDADGRVAWFNRRWYEYTGLSVEDSLEGGHASLDPADVPRVLEDWKRARDAGVPWEDEVRLHRRDGVSRWHLSRAVPVRDEHGRIVRWLGTSTDIEEQKRTIAELRRAEEEAREIGRLQERLVAIVGHDLRTPLSVIHLGVSALVQRGGLSPEQERTLARVARSAQRMRGIIDDLLDFSRARQGMGIPVAHQPADLAEVCRRALAELGPLSGGRRSRSRSTATPRSRGDPGRLSQVVSNLVGNAVQHGSGPVQVTLASGEDEVRLSVRNEGPPIPREILPHLFEPFRRGERGDGKSGSIGLGLFIVREVVRAHGGDVEVRSGQQDTLFTVRLPRGGRAAAAAGPRSAASP